MLAKYNYFGVLYVLNYLLVYNVTKHYQLGWYICVMINSKYPPQSVSESSQRNNQQLISLKNLLTNRKNECPEADLKN